MTHDDAYAYATLLDLANQGNLKAENLLAEMLSGGYRDIAQDHVTALNLYCRALEQGDPYASGNIALLYQKGGFGVPKDYAKSVDWNQKIIEQGGLSSQLARIALGEIFQEGGYGVQQDYVEAYKWLSTVAQNKSWSRDCEGSHNLSDLDLACTAAIQRDQLSVKMTRPQIVEGQRRASEWRPPARRS